MHNITNRNTPLQSVTLRYQPFKGLRKPRKKCKKNPGIELLSHTLMCSTIVAGPLIDRVRDGNVSFKPAIDTGKKYVIKIVVLLLRLEKKQNNR